MLTIPLLHRLFRTSDHDGLIRGLTGNGLVLPLPLRVRLSASRPAAIGLALRRVVDLSYGPTPLSREMTHALLDLQRPDGAFESEGRPDPLATAAGAAGLARVIRDQPRAAGLDVRESHRRAAAALADMQGEDGLFETPLDRCLGSRTLTGLLTLFLLGDDDAFAAAVRVGDLAARLEDLEPTLSPQARTLWHMASLAAPATARVGGPEVAAPLAAAA